MAKTNIKQQPQQLDLFQVQLEYPEEIGDFSVRSDEKYHAVLEEAQRIHSVAWYISMITDDYISLDEELQELEKQREFDGDLYTFN